MPKPKIATVELHLIGGPQDGDVANVAREALQVGRIFQLEWPSPRGGRHVYQSLTTWSGKGKSVRLHHRGKVYA